MPITAGTVVRVHVDLHPRDWPAGSLALVEDTWMDGKAVNIAMGQDGSGPRTTIWHHMVHPA
ncbi:hypothetical protein ACIQTN_29635 [Streptomyces werraensis]|uniref:hypothetical protein n=1 Tax=Streptomyces werraensis TaxID=68284 RepID=UPI0037F521AB